MLKDTKIHQIIGISGAARSGKDTLCRAIIRVLSNTYNINAIRRSIAGDQVKKDLQELLLKNLKINSFTEDMTVKEEIRPLLVEYGKLMRNKTDGRYFIEKFKKVENKINIIPDIRYVEYSRDEAYWLKNEMKGFLIFIERENIFDANDTEKVNNKIIKGMADYFMCWKSLDESKEEDINIINDYATDIVNKMLTTYR
jgi:uncharacterized protein Smg (DUF494 family)